MSHPRQPCVCGKPKEAGPGKKFCSECKAARVCISERCGAPLAALELCKRHLNALRGQVHLSNRSGLSCGLTGRLVTTTLGEVTCGLCVRRCSPPPVCTEQGCDLPASRADLCRKHDARQKRHGSAADKRGSWADEETRFWRFVSPAGEVVCWEWTGNRNNNGYGKLGSVYAHRVSYRINNGPIPKGLLVMHSCDNPPCVNPAHLGVGTHAENSSDMVRKGRHRLAYTA